MVFSQLSLFVTAACFICTIDFPITSYALNATNAIAHAMPSGHANQTNMGTSRHSDPRQVNTVHVKR